MTSLMFFYGTLMSGGPRGHVLNGLAEPQGEAAIRGRLYQVRSGWFPAVLPGEGTVYGEVWEASDLPATLAICDSIEGYRPGDPFSMYVRQEVALLQGAHGGERAWTYIWNGSPAELTAIPSGRWREPRPAGHR